MTLRRNISHILNKHLNENTNAQYSQFPLNSLLIFARKFKSFNNFSTWYSVHLNHGYYWHLTHDKNFNYSELISPRDMSSMADEYDINHGALMITGDLDNWHYHYNVDPETEEEDIKRNYAVLFDASALNPAVLKQVTRGFGNEIFLPKNEAKKLKIINIYEIKEALKIDQQLSNIIPQSREELYDLWNYANNKGL